MIPGHQIRHFHTAIVRMVRGVGRRSNPGIGHQITSMETVDERLTQDPEGFGDLESDFMTAHETHREHESETAQNRERIRKLMVKHKYFRETKLPNLLTYAEKEQIRTLHARDPEEWTAERLAESFPATTEIIKKILDAKWQARSTERIRKHDEVVIRNWEKFRTDPNLLQLPRHFQEHLEKFATRKTEDLVALSEGLPSKATLPRPTKQEFLSIITSCDKYAEKEDVPQLQTGELCNKRNSLASSAPEDETYLLDKVYDKRRMRLQDLKKYKLIPNELADTSNELANKKSIDQNAAMELRNPSGTGVISTNSQKNPLVDLNLLQKYESNEVVISVEDQKRFEITRVKDRIHIPRKLWRKGATYRVEDVYYDDDGEFLYRVPGMTGRSR
ncbi:uncharacterized protein LOC101455137 [Ceratitis capitata]|uniref:(Mediterranean fruit fly) hypothetical protein n=1 Tax=Ceratitis capitata TaxID=7213 RepID=W8BCH6_CERCA|nr:uncharacterized protein LOC101455137 [Ceratitis capitata]CAD6991784.1 unnamed protein product [Ceratitis capitata]